MKSTAKILSRSLFHIYLFGKVNLCAIFFNLTQLNDLCRYQPNNTDPQKPSYNLSCFISSAIKSLSTKDKEDWNGFNESRVCGKPGLRSLYSKVVFVNRSILSALILLGGTVVKAGKAIIICSTE